jgi:gentisate 1,2-dioxygenase
MTELMNDLQDLEQLKIESLGWIPLEEGAYLHVRSDQPVIQVVGLAKEEMAGNNVLWLI